MSEITTKSVSRFIYDQKGLTGFIKPEEKALQVIREIVENSLDSCEKVKVLPEIVIQINKQSEYYSVQAVDNGSGVKDEDIPLAFGTMLASSKYSNVQSRGLFGIGIKNVLLHAQVSTNKPYLVASSTSKVGKVSYYELMMDIEQNKPIILNHEIRSNRHYWQGLGLSFTIGGVDFEKAEKDILTYLKQTTIVAPHAKITFILGEKKYEFERKIKEVPEPPRETSPHPYDIDPLDMKKMIENTKYETLLEFFTKTFYGVGRLTAERFFKFAKLDPNINPKTLNHDQIIYLINMMNKFDGWRPPAKESLSPIGEKAFIAGVKSVYPESVIDFITYSSRTDVFGGSPFAVEVVCVLLKGRVEEGKDNITVWRYVNKIPLIYQYKSCLLSQVVYDQPLKHYKIEPTMPIVFHVHLCTSSKRTLFKDLTKGIIADIPEIRRALDLTIKDCLRDVEDFILHREKFEEHKKRMSRFQIYSRIISEHLAKITKHDKIMIEQLISDVLGLGEENVSNQ